MTSNFYPHDSFQVYDIYPYLQNYANNWAVADFLHVHLKNKAQATKKLK